jgi:putative ABC transport system permease protein
MSAIGATPVMLARNVWLESLTLGLLSWVAACLVTLPITLVLEWACGWIFFKVGLDFYVWPAALGIWLALVLVLSTLAALQPAWRAARLTVREALSHT